MPTKETWLPKEKTQCDTFLVKKQIDAPEDNTTSPSRKRAGEKISISSLDNFTGQVSMSDKGKLVAREDTCESSATLEAHNPGQTQVLAV